MKTQFTRQFQKYACDGDSITCTVNGFECTATIHHDDCSDRPDERQDGFWPSLDPASAGYIGAKSKSTLARHHARAERTMQAWLDNEWFYCGIAVTVSLRDVQLTKQFHHAVWGIECNLSNGRYRTNGYLRDVANELLDEALEDAQNVLDDLLAGVTA